jgi:hypothetical protein
MILNIFKLEAPREKGKCGSKMVKKGGKKHFWFVCFSGREMVVVLNLNQDASLAFCLWLDLLFGSLTLFADSRKQKNR